MVCFKNWFIDKFPVFFRGIINHEGSLDFTTPNTDYIRDAIVKKNFKKARPYIQYFFKRLIAVTTFKEMPQQLVKFLDEFFSHGSPVETNTLTLFERDRISIDEYNTLFDMSQHVKDFLRLYFIIGKGLLILTMLSEDSFGTKLNSTSIKNLKIIASVIYHVMMDYLNIILQCKNEYDETNPTYEPISQMVFEKDRLAYLTEVHPKFYNECKGYLSKWLKQLNNIIVQICKGKHK
mmetsp:Transcript_23697/g.21060  ORF Transcript_23697/g.21060 Transcript_23697/m.21060 type:complete len:235 (+) Transcript_23697:210-914(+)